MKRTFPILKPETRPSVTKPEREFASRFGTKALTVKFTGRTDLMGLQVLGKKFGIVVEHDEEKERIIRLLAIHPRGIIIRTHRAYKLPFTKSPENMIPGLFNFVQ